jgi:hypothetical protein
MYGNSVVRQFEAMGARARVLLTGLRFELDIITDRNGELFEVRVPQDGTVIMRVDDVEKRNRQLLLAVRNPTHQWSQRFLCGHDERDWFVAALPKKPEATSVKEAFEALKPRAVLAAQEWMGIPRRQRQRRHTAAYLRQGEWFFVPRSELIVEPRQVRHKDILVRARGTPHIVEWLYRPSGSTALFARGTVSHPDHKDIQLKLWHQVYRNREVEAVEQPMANMMPLAPKQQPWNLQYID